MSNIQNIKNVMASKYPTPIKSKEKLDSSPQTTGSKWNVNTIFIVTIVLSLFYFVLTNPHTFQFIGKFFPNLVSANLASNLDIKIVAINTLVFAIFTFLTITIANRG